ncbi:MAG: hypothetical protein Q4D82_01095 [Neisseria sp.]|nr:hypothetical protein [Neisseria sp.]
MNNADVYEQVQDLLLWAEPEAKKLMVETMTEYGVSVDALAELVAWERANQEKRSRYGMTQTFDEVFGNREYWKS